MEKDKEYDFFVYTHFREDDYMSHDWSLTVWSDESPVEIRHADGIKSASWEVQKLRKTTPIPKNFPEGDPEPSFEKM